MTKALDVLAQASEARFIKVDGEHAPFVVHSLGDGGGFASGRGAEVDGAVDAAEEVELLVDLLLRGLVVDLCDSWCLRMIFGFFFINPL